MAFRKIYDGLRLIAKALGTSSRLGDIEAIETDPDEGYVDLHNGVSASKILTADHAATVTNKTISGTNNTLTDIDGDSLVNNSVDLVKLSKVGNNRVLYSDLDGDIGVLDQLTSQKVVVTDGNGLPTTATASNAEVDHLVGVTSGIQNQLDSKLPLAGGTLTGTLDLDDNSIINVPDPVSNQDAVNKRYVDAIAQGLDLKSSVRVATTIAGTLATSFENGQSVDGVTLVTGNRILIKNQSSQIENGIYVVQASGAPIRSADADTWTKLVGAFCFVEEGTTNGDTGWACNINSTGTLGVNDVTFVQFSAAGVAEAGAGLTKTGTTFSVNVDNSTTEISGNNVIVKAGGLTNTQISALAAIARSKLASGTASHVLINDGSGVMSSEATLAKSRGGSGQDNSSLTFPASGTLATLAGTEVFTNKDYDGGTASNSSRLTLPKNTKTNLDSLNRKEGTLVYATDQAKAFIDNGSSLIAVGSGSGGGGINYIENFDAETNTDGWGTYADAAGTAPVDGTGGTANITWTRSTSSPLRGDGSFLLTKDAANRQGEGASYNFTIDEADKAKVMQIGFDYAVASGTYATGDVAIYIVDVTNGTVIQPSAYQVENVGVNSTARLTFQTASNSTSYRLCFHVASVSTSAYSLKFDNINLGPQVVPLGAPVTDWVSYTPIIAAISGTPTNYTVYGEWRRNGDSADFRYRLVFTGAVGTWQQPIFSLPSGMTVDATKIPGGDVLKFRAFNAGSLFDDSTGTSYQATGTIYTATTLLVNLPSVATHTGTVPVQPTGITQAVPFSWATSDEIRFEVHGVPIVGWSSSTVVSSSANTRTVVTKLIRSTSATGINPNASYVKIPLNTVNIDTVGAADVANNQVVIKVPGKYNVSWSLGISSTNVLASQYLSAVYKNSAAEGYGNTCTPAATTSFVSAGSTDMELAVGDILDLRLYGAGNNSVNTLQSFTGNGVSFSVSLIQGPSQIAMSEIVSMVCYKNTGSHTSNGNFQDVTSWNTVTKDSHGGFNTTTGVYTCPAPGDYMLTAAPYFAANVTGIRVAAALKDGVIVAYSPNVSAATSNTAEVNMLIPNCVAGTQIKLQGYQNSGGNLNYDTATNTTRMCIYRLGGM